MAREIRRARYLSEISSVRELREARRELELREWFARERLEADIYETFTLDNLVAMVAPPGSILDRVIGGVGTGFAVVQGVLGTLGSVLGGLWSKGDRSAAKVVRTRPAARKPVVAAKPAARKISATKPAAKKTAIRKRTPEIEVEVELEKPRAPRTRKK